MFYISGKHVNKDMFIFEDATGAIDVTILSDEEAIHRLILFLNNKSACNPSPFCL
jgi:hypothetical protein